VFDIRPPHCNKHPVSLAREDDREKGAMMSKLTTVLASLVAVFVLVGAGALIPSARAAATAKPCWERVLDDWLGANIGRS
jgi:hypothetical protein